MASVKGGPGEEPDPPVGGRIEDKDSNAFRNADAMGEWLTCAR